MLTVNSTINLAGQAVPNIIPAVQGDTGRVIVFTLADFTIPSGSTATYYVQKPSGEAVYNSATIDGNKVTVELTAQSLAETGDNYGQVRILNGEDVVTSFDFILLVKPFRGIDAVESTSEMNIFDTAVQNAMANIDGMLPNIIAPVFDTSTAYTAGDYVLYGGKLYQFTAVHTGAWTEADAEETTIAEELGEGGSGDGLTEDIKAALLQIARKVAYIDENGQTYYDALYDALYAVTAIRLNTNSISLQAIGATSQLTATTTPEGGRVTWSSSNDSVATVSSTGLVTSVAYGSATITATAGSVSVTCSVLVARATCTSITATYTQSGTVYDTATLDSLKSNLVVTASWSDSTTTTLDASDYTLSGTLAVGTSTITVSYGGHTATFTVTVSAEEWTVVRTIGDNYTSGKVSQTTGAVGEDTSWYTSNLIEVPDGATSFSRITSRTSDWFLVWYDSEQNFIGNGLHGTYSSNAQYGGGYTVDGVLWNAVPVTAKYCRVSWRTSATYTSITFAGNAKLDESKTPVADKLYYYTYDPTATGTTIANDDFLPCAGMAYAQIRPVTQRSITFYDADFIQVSQIARATNKGNNVEIPSDAVYLKCQNSNVVTQTGSNTTLIGQRLLMFTTETKTEW